MNNLNSQLREAFGSQEIGIDELKQIFSAFSRVSEKCVIDDDTTLEQLMTLLKEKTSTITYTQVEDMLYSYFLEAYDLEQVEAFLKLCVEQNKNQAGVVSFEVVTSLGQQIQNDTGVNLPFLEDIICLCQQHERGLVHLNEALRTFGITSIKRQLSIDINVLSPQSDISSMRGLSTSKLFTQVFTPGPNQIKGLLNLTYQRFDLMKKHAKKNKILDKLIKEVMRIQKKLEYEIDSLKEQQPPPVDDYNEQRLADLEHEVRRYQEQVSQMIDDNEAMLDQLNDAQADVESLNQKLVSSQKEVFETEDQLKTMSTEIRKKDNEIRDLKQTISKHQRETIHLQENNSELLKMLEKMEQSHNEDLTKTRHSTIAEFSNDATLINLKQQLQFLEKENNKLTGEVDYYQTQMKYTQNQCSLLEEQLSNIRREQVKYKKMFEDANEEIVTHRQSIARMSVMGLQGMKSGSISARQSIALGNNAIGFPKIFQGQQTPNTGNEIQEESDEGSSSEKSSDSHIQPPAQVFTQKDFLKISKHRKIVEILEEEVEKYELQFQRLLSCEIIEVNKVETEFIFKEKKFIVITDYQFFVFDDIDIEFEISQTKLLADIKSVTLSQSNPKLIGLQFGNVEYFCSCVHRSDITVFLTDSFIMRKLPLFRQVYTKDISRKQSMIQVENKAPAQNLFRMEYVELYQNSDWIRYFCILTNVGILLFKEPCDIVPQMFLVLTNTIIVKNPTIDDVEIRHSIKLSGDLDFILRFESEYEQSEWIEKMKQITKQFM